MNAEPHTIPFGSAARELGVVIGFDGSENATWALRHAARTALRRGSVLTVAAAYRVPIPMYAPYAAVPAEPDDGVRQREAEAVLDQAAELLKGHPGEVSYLTTVGDSVGALVDLSAKAQLIVVGARGRGGFLGLLLGSVASSLPAHAHCPTVVVPAGDRQGDAADREPVVVGMDESSHSRVAALQAARVAQELDTSLLALMALPSLDARLLWYPELSCEVTGLTEQRQAELQEALETDIAWLKGHFPAVEMSSEVRIGDAVSVLSEATGSAQMTVVGSRGRGAVASVVLGSTSRTILHKAIGAVMVVPFVEDDRLPD
ncbi:universal stress protein [Aeromicrobium sp. CTD01-1L150]|uniref:universal stress protein n=1 Tax=Aeromicrobium sp. CTD01-1L150 TaxID=3341830 RepID=UPI0035C06AD8